MRSALSFRSWTGLSQEHKGMSRHGRTNRKSKEGRRAEPRGKRKSGAEPQGKQASRVMRHSGRRRSKLSGGLRRRTQQQRAHSAAAAARSVLEVAHARGQQRHAILVAAGNGVLVAHGAAGVHDGRHARLARNLHAVVPAAVNGRGGTELDFMNSQSWGHQRGHIILLKQF